MPAGLEPYFEWVNNTCSQLPNDRTQCNFTPVYDYTVSPVRTDITLGTRTAGTPAPPEPVVLAVEKGASSPEDRRVAKGATDVSVLQVQAASVNGRSMLQALTLKASGSGRDDLDLTTIKVVLDGNGNGIADPGETVLAEGRPAADDGTLRLVLASPLAIDAAAQIIVVADVAGDVHVAALAGGGAVLASLGPLGVPWVRRRRGVAMAMAMALVVGMALVAGCGGGSGDDGSGDPAAVDPPPPLVAVLVTYRIDLVSIEATNTATPAAPVTVSSLPVAGATITVTK